MDSLTPRVIPLLTYLLYDNRLTAPLLRSFLRLLAAAWQHDFRRSEPLDFHSQLSKILDLSPSHAHRHLQQLQCAGLLDWQIDNKRQYVINFSALDDSQNAQMRICASPESDDGVNSLNINNNINLKDSHQQHTQAHNALKRFSRITSASDAPALSAAPSAAQSPTTASTATADHSPQDQPPATDHMQRFVLDCLARAGVWSDVALQISDQISANQRAADPHQPGAADVLGWMAYCFGEQHKNSIHTPAAVLARNLQSGRRCPENLRPQPICARCHRQISACVCPEGPQGCYPVEFIEAAFKVKNYNYNITRWGVCKSCQSFPCQCQESL